MEARSIRGILLFAGLLLAAPALAADGARTFTFRYATTVGPVPAGAGLCIGERRRCCGAQPGR
jgi:hypothetical protein